MARIVERKGVAGAWVATALYGLGAGSLSDVSRFLHDRHLWRSELGVILLR